MRCTLSFFKSKKAIFSLLAAVGLLILLWDILLVNLANFYLKNYFKSQFGVELAMEKISRKKNEWVVSSPAIAFSGGEFAAEKVTISYVPLLWERKIECRIRLKNPLFELNRQTLAVLDSLKKLDVEKGFFEYHLFIDVENGKAVAEHLPDFHFNLQEELGPYSRCVFCGGFSGEDQVQGYYVFQEDLHPNINIFFKDFDLESASLWAEHFHPGAVEWTSQGGKINGFWSVDPHFRWGAGDLNISELTLTSVDNPFTIHIPSLTTRKKEGGTIIVVDNRGKLAVEADQDFKVDLYHFGGELFLDQKGAFTGRFEGLASLGEPQPNLEVSVIVDQANQADLFEYQVKGPMKSLLTKLPQKYQTVLNTTFGSTHTILEGKCKPITKGVELHSRLKLLEEDRVLLEDFNIYCRIDPTTSRFIDAGNFRVNRMNLEQVFSPFMFPEQQFQLHGEAYMEGVWTPQQMHVKYRTYGASMENDSLLFTIPKAEEEELAISESLPGVHYFDFERNHHYGRLYVENGSYLEKKTGLLFDQVQTQIVFEGKSLHATQLQTFSQGIRFEGGISLDYSSPLKRTFDLDLMIQKMEGKVSQFQDFLSHFPQSPFLQQLPIEGKIVNGRMENSLALHFKSGNCTIEADIQGMLLEGKTTEEFDAIRAEDLSFEFAYHHQNKTLSLENVTGFLKVGRPEVQRVFLIEGEGVRFKDYQKHIGDFSIAFHDGQKEFIRLAGGITPMESSFKPHGVKVNFDPDRCRLWDGQPIRCECSLSDWQELEELTLFFELQVPGVLKEIQEDVKCGLITLSDPFLQEINGWVENQEVEGAVSLNIAYDRPTSLITLAGEGKKIRLGKRPFDAIHLEAKKRHHTWMIEQLKVDDFSLSADLQKEGSDWKLNFLGIRWGDALLAGLEGKWDFSGRQLSTQVNLFELDLVKALEMPQLKEMLPESTLAGELRGTGELSLRMIEESPGFVCDVLGNLSCKDVSFDQIPLEDTQNVSFHLRSDKTIALRNFKTKTLGVDLLIEKCCYSPYSDVIEMENIAFEYPVVEGDRWMSILQAHYPDLMTSSLRETIHGLKAEGAMKGAFDLSLSENFHQFSLRLQDDIYHWKGVPYPVKNFEMTSIPQEKRFVFQTQWQKIAPWIDVKTGTGEVGTVAVSGVDPRKEKEYSSLLIEWKNPSQKPLEICKVKGSVFGAETDLSLSGENYKGYFTCHIPEITPLLSDDYEQALQKAQLKGSYRFEGEWRLPFEEKEWFKKLSFSGFLSGQSCAVKGYYFDQLAGVCSITPQEFKLENCRIADEAFEGELESLVASYERDADTPTRFRVNHFVLNDVKPHLLKKETGEEVSSKKDLLFNRVEITECFGELGDTETYQGNGFLQFSTKTKRGIESTPFALPAEIISRLGLNSSIMTPVRGVALVDIGHGRCYISKLKDTYSRGKLSKFMVYNSKEPSYVDFDGNLHVQIRIKHYNLLFKLSEMFTINVRGTVQKPLYYLQK